MKMKQLLISAVIIFVLVLGQLVIFNLFIDPKEPENDALTAASQRRPEAVGEFEKEEDEEDEMNPAKFAPWTPEEAAKHQKILAERMDKRNIQRQTAETFANGAVSGKWVNRGPRNMPGAFKFATMLDGTDTMYAVTWNHYSGEYNSKSYIFRGTVYNKTLGQGGDDFVRLTGHWPNRYKNLHAFKYNGTTRLIAHIENGPIYYSDDQGETWTLSTGLPSVIQSSITNPQDSYRVYVTDGTSVYSSDNGGESFTSLQNFGSSASSALYTPRYDVQPNASTVYLVRSGTFYTLNSAKTSFTQNGSFTTSHGTNKLSIAGDSRKLYVTENKKYWVSTNGGTNWTQKYPKGNWYGDRTGDMPAGEYLAVSPVDAQSVVAGYAQPVFSTDGLDTDQSDDAGWGWYQNGTNLSASAYYDRIRFSYHPDFQASHFFYNASGELFTARCSDGGIFISYKEWFDLPINGNYDNSGYTNGHYINITTLGTVCPLVYRDNLITGYKHPDHIIYSTQDQGTGSILEPGTGDLLDFYQSIGGDGPPLGSYDGKSVWKWKRQGSEVYAPVQMYDASGNMRSAGSMNGMFSTKITFTENTAMGWVQAVFDHDEPGNRMWLLTRTLNRAEYVNGSLTGTTITKGSNQVAALAQGWSNPDVLWMLQGGSIYKSTNRGDSFGSALSTPFSATGSGWGNGDIGSGTVLPTDDNWILFCGPSNNSVGSILSKDGGTTWVDVTGNFPAGSDAQTGAIVATPDGKLVFAGTDIGPWVFVVSEEAWYPMGGGVASYFNAMDGQYIASENVVRFASWGSGIWDFRIGDVVEPDPYVTIVKPNDGDVYNIGEVINITWSSNLENNVTISLVSNSGGVDITTATASSNSYSYTVPDDIILGDYLIIIKDADSDTVSDTSGVFEINNYILLEQSHLTVESFDSEQSGDNAVNAIDGNASTIWHTEYSPNTPTHPHEIVFNVDTTVKLAAFSYLPRQDGGDNGKVANFEIYVSNNGTDWASVKVGTITNTANESFIVFDTQQAASFVKFEAKSEVNGNAWTSMAEFNLYYVPADFSPNSENFAINKPHIALLGMTSSKINLSIANKGVYQIKMVTLDGRTLFSEKKELLAGFNSVEMNRSKIARGMYLLSVQGAGERFVRKISLR